MPEVMFNGPAGRLEGRFSPARESSAPLALILHMHPKFGGTMNSRLIHRLYYMFVRRGFATLRFNFRGVGRSSGEFDHGQGELADAAAALDWMQSQRSQARACWVAGFSFGAWISMQLLMRRPEIKGFLSIAPPANVHDFSFLAPCPSSGLIIHGSADKVALPAKIQQLVNKLQDQKNIEVTQTVIEGGNHFFSGHLDELIRACDEYLCSQMRQAGYEVPDYVPQADDEDLAP